MVGHIPLEDIILVRIQVSQLWLENQQLDKESGG